MELKNDVPVQIGRLRSILPLTFLTKLIENFRVTKEIEEVYIYSQKMNAEVITVLGIVLSVSTQENADAAYLAFKIALVGENLDSPNMMIILNNNESLLQYVQEIENALFYKKQ